MQVDITKDINTPKEMDSLLRCITKIVETFKKVEQASTSELLFVTKKKSDKRHTRKSKTLSEYLRNIEDEFGYKTYYNAIACLHINLNKTL